MEVLTVSSRAGSLLGALATYFHSRARGKRAKQINNTKPAHAAGLIAHFSDISESLPLGQLLHKHFCNI